MLYEGAARNLRVQKAPIASPIHHPLPYPNRTTCQVQHGTSLPGLKYWHLPTEDAEEVPSCWSSWRTWPHLLLSLDQGSDGLSGAHAALYDQNLRLNCSAHYDPSHGSWRDIQGCIRDSGLYQWCLLGLCTMNLSHGPELTDLRFAQIRDAMLHCKNTHTAASCSLFTEHVEKIIAELGDHIDSTDFQTKEEAAFEWVMTHSMFQRKGYKVNLNRFHSFIAESKLLLEEWHTRLFQVQYVCLELDFVSNKAMKQKVAARVGGGGRGCDAVDLKDIAAGGRPDLARRRAKRGCHRVVVPREPIES